VPHFKAFSAADIQAGEHLDPGWTLLPFPRNWDELEGGVNKYLDAVWPDWRCPHCKHRFWAVLEPVRLESATAWPIKANSNYGAYPVVPVVCTWCKQVTPILLFSIFEAAAGAVNEPETGS
jgi:hypothetical protein